MSELGEKILVDELENHKYMEICVKDSDGVYCGKFWRIKDGWVQVKTEKTIICFPAASSEVNYYKHKPRF